ncbi:MAG: hypothetical protein ABFS14_10360 [Gemmatimonadota bacterium]
MNAYQRTTALLVATLPVLAAACEDPPLGVQDQLALRTSATTAAETAQTSVHVPGPPLPFRATYTIAADLLFPGDPAYPARCPTGPTNAAGPASGEGYATHLGYITETENACIDFATLSLTLGEFTLTAANGDEVWGEFEASASFDPPPPNANFTCSWQIVGGTGRFVGATGAGDCPGSHQLGDGTSLIIFEGWIRYDASN